MLPTDISDDMAGFVVAEIMKNTHCLVVDGGIGSEERHLIIKGFSIPGDEGRRDIKGVAIDKGIGLGIPCNICSSTMGDTKSSIGER